MVRHALALSGAAFLLHFAWESVQCPLFFVHGSYDPTWRGMLMASLGDVVLTWGVYGAVAAVSGNKLGLVRIEVAWVLAITTN